MSKRTRAEILVEKAEIQKLLRNVDGVPDPTLEKKLAELEAQEKSLEEEASKNNAVENVTEENEQNIDEMTDLDRHIAELNQSGQKYSISVRGNMVAITTRVSFGEAIQKGIEAGKKTFDDLNKAFGLDMLYSEMHSDLKDIAQNLRGAGVKFDGALNRQWHNAKGEKSESPNLQDDSPDNEWYDDQRLESAVKNGLEKNGDNKSEIAGATPIGTAASGAPEVFNEILQDRISDAAKTAQNGKTVLMPFQVNDNHWVAGAMSKTQEGKLQFVHNDPFGKAIDKKLQTALQKQGVEIIDLQKPQQSDQHNCGAFTADNLVQFAAAIKKAQGQDLTQNDDFKKHLDSQMAKGKDAGDELRKSQSNLESVASARATDLADKPKTPEEERGR